MTNAEIEGYQARVKQHLDELTPFLKNYALGDFTEEIIIPEEEDEFTALLVGIKLMVKDFREMLDDLQAAQRDLTLKNMVFDASVAANSIADNEGVITHVNPAFLQLWGYASAEEAIGNSVASFFANPEDAIPVMEALNTCGRWEGEFLARREDGSQFLSRGLATVVRDRSGEQLGYQSANLDMTAQRQAEAELADRVLELESFNRIAVGRERRMIELKEEVNSLAQELGREAPYDLAFAR